MIDTSMALAWYFDDEVTASTDEVLSRVTRQGAIVPSLWRFEVANVLRTAVHRRRIEAGYRNSILASLSALDIMLDPESETQAWSASMQLSDRHSLTVYDAAYLELAQRRRLTLATPDKALIRACGAELVPVIGT